MKVAEGHTYSKVILHTGYKYLEVTGERGEVEKRSSEKEELTFDVF
jgi:hypothetical protein